MLTGATRLTMQLVQRFTEAYDIVDHHANDATGFSATLIQERGTNNFTLSFRSLEYHDQAQGGDWERDGRDGAAGEVATQGFAFGQLVSMERYYRELKASGALPQDAVLNVTGYSLGGHLATVFTELHRADIQDTYIFNGAGRGHISGGTPGLSEAERIREMLDVLEFNLLALDPEGTLFRSGAGGNVQADSRYQAALLATKGIYTTTISALSPGEVGTSEAFQKITQLFGHATSSVDPEIVANSGVHGVVTPILIEGQPLVESVREREYGNSHSITLMVDSLALQELFQAADPTLTQVQIEMIFKAASDVKAGLVGQTHVAEGDTLELALDALRKVFVGPGVLPTGFNDNGGGFGDLARRTEFYTNLQGVKNALNGQTYQIVSFTTKTSGEIYAAARNADPTGVASRFALQALSPFAVVGADYTLHNTNGALDFYNAQTGQGTWTLNALSDRAELLAETLKFTLADGMPSNASATLYEDKTTVFDNGRHATATQVVIFGGIDNDPLDGRSGNDHLYGGAGADVLSGFAGQDYLEGGADDDMIDGGSENDILLGQRGTDTLMGGAGNDQLNGGLDTDRLEGGEGTDTYYYWTGQGNDTIVDADRLGVVRFDNTILQGGLHRSTDPANTYVGSDGQFTYVKSGTNLVINDALTIENFDFTNGALGIKLVEAPDTVMSSVPTIDYGVNGFPTETINLPPSGAWVIERVGFVNYIISGGRGSYVVHTGPGNDQLYGGPNTDRLSSRGGTDRLEGFAGGDNLYGWEDDDLLMGGDGADHLYGDLALDQAGQDYLDGGTGDDFMVGGSEDDVLIGGTGNDTLLAEGGTTNITFDPDGFIFTMDYSLGSGRDTVDGGEGDDTLVGFAGADILLGGDGIDLLVGDFDGGIYSIPWDPSQDGGDYLDGGSGNDTLYGGGLADVLIGGSGDDVLLGEGLAYGALAGDDWLEGGDGTDQLFGGLGGDALFGGIGDDLLIGDYVNEPGADDMLDGGAGMDELQGGGGNDLLVGGTENDRLFGQDGVDLLDGEEGDDLVKGDEGNDTLFGGDGIDELQGGNGDDELAGDAGDDFLLGDGGNDTLFGDEGADRLQGGIGNDLISGDAGNDGLFGEDGADTLFGDEGNDELLGGTGNDIVDGGAGNDIYIITPGDGQDEVFEEDIVGELNTILFDPSITREMLTFTHNAAENTLFVQVGASSDSILVHGFTNTGINRTGGIQNIVAGGQTFALADLLGLPSGEIVGTFGNDIIKTGSGNDTIFSGDGDDTITANSGNDVLIGGAGNDTYTFALGDGIDTISDTVVAGQGNRILFGAGITAATLTYTQSANTLTIAYNGSADAVQLMGFDENTVLGSLVVSAIEFADGNVVNLADLFPPFTNHLPTVANPIADQTAPEDGSWTFVVPANTFADEDAGDVLTLSASLVDGTALPAWLSFDAETATFSGTADDAQVGTIGLRVTAADGRNAIASDTFNVTITNVNEAPTVAAPLADQAATKDVLFEFVVPTGTFADVDPGDSLTYSATLADNSPLPTWLQFNPATRTFSGTPQFADVGTVNVKVTAMDTGSLSAADVFALTVAHGLNEIIGTPASENLAGTAGNDLIRGLGGSDSLSGLDGNDTLEGGDGDDYLYGGAGNNLLRGGTGWDRLEGYTGDDTFQGGSGNDSLHDDYGGQNVYIFDRGDGQDTIYSRYGTVRFASGVSPTDVTVRGKSDGLVLSINDTTDKMTLFGWLNPFNTSRIDRVEFADGTVWTGGTLQAMANAGTSGDDSLSGTNGNDALSGLGGNDRIETYDGDDVLDGGAGDDSLFGGSGNDTYVFGRGYGVDLVQDGGTGNIIQLTAGVLIADVTLLQNGGRVMLSIDQSATQIGFTTMEQIRFHDGTIWDAAAIASHTFVGAVNSMTGTAGNDTFVVDNAQDMVTEGTNQGTDTIQSLVSYTLPSNVENLTLTGHFNVDGTGNLLDNVIIGNSGNNRLEGSVNDYNGGGSDTLQGGLGDDSYTVVGNADTVIEAPNEGSDTITLIGDWNRGWSYSLPDNVENLTVNQAFDVVWQARTFYGNDLNNVIKGDPDWMNYIDGGLGADTMIGGTGSDTYVVDDVGDTVNESGVLTDTVMSSINFTLGFNLDNLTLTGTASINGTGNDLNNVLTGNGAANVLTGGTGNDTYVIGAGDTIVELPGEGIDTVSTDQSFVLSADLADVLENVTLTGMESINATGNAANNVLTGNSANNVLDGGGGADQLIGGAGDDTYILGAGDVVVEEIFGGADTIVIDHTYTLGSELENLVLTGTDSINGAGNELDNVLTGNSGANVLTGGTGNDTYVVDGADTIVEHPDEGWGDTVLASVSWTLAPDLENLTLTGTAAINGTGNGQNNILAGNSGANVLTGGAGDDTYVVDGGDTIVEATNQGTDLVMSSDTFILTPEVEYLTLTGTEAINGTGNALDNMLNGNAGANVLDGGIGADWMIGYGGDDTYIVDNAGDLVEEEPAEGIDTVQSSLTYILGANVENLTLTGTTAINGTGNALNNVLTGNSAANALVGGAGNDTYIVDAGDTVTESSGQGTDTVQSAVTFALGANVEKLTLTGTAAINGTGNTLNNTIIGNSGANVLSGGTGADAMSGGAGDDTYVRDNAGDTVTENADEGTDTVQSTLTYTLGGNVENLTLTGTSAINGTGNTLDNVLTGNSGANVLTGGTGNDTYVVGTGDSVVENAGADTDTVHSSVTWTLAANIENLTLTGTGAINGTGNTLDNIITGNSGANVLNGGAGIDSMTGAAGNDTYVVDNVEDVVT